MNIFNSNKQSKSSEILNSLGYWALLLLVVVLPIFVFTSSNVPSLMVKIFVGGSLVFIALLFFAIQYIRAQEIQIPKSLILFGVWALPFAYILSSVFTPKGQAFFGEQLTMDSTVFMLIIAIAVTVTAMTLNSIKRSLGLYLSMLGAVTILSLAEIVIFFARDNVSTWGLQSVSLVGTLNDLAVFFGLIAIFVMLSLILLPITALVRGVLWVVLFASSFFLIVANLTVLWWIMGAFSLAFLVYSISNAYFSKKVLLDNISFASLFVFALSAYFIFGGPLTGDIASWANVGEYDVRPSWPTTIAMADRVLGEESLLFGSGPGTFSNVWFKYLPVNINVTAFWLTPFPYGIGLVPTSFVTTGLIGALAWFAFFVLFVWRGARNLLVSDESFGNVGDYIKITSFVAALYIWINTVIQVPSPVIVLYGAILTGVFIASLHFNAGSSKYFKIVFKDNPKVGFLVTLILTCTALGSLGGVYGLSSRYVAEANFQRAAKIVSEEGQNPEKLDEAYVYATKAIESTKSDVYYRFISNIDAIRIQNLLSQGKPAEEIKEEYEGLLARSITNAKEATALDKYDYQNWANLGNIYHNNIQYGVEGVIDSAISAYDEALVQRPNAPSVLYAKAVLEHSRGDNVKSREYIEKAITMRNQYTDAIFLLAQLQIENNEVQNAIKSVEAITLFNPRNAVAFFQLGLLHYAAEEFTKAVQAFERATEISPDYANAQYFLGLSYWRIGNNVRALEEFKKVKETNPDNTEVSAVIANLEAGKDPFTSNATSTAADIQTRAGLPFENGVGESVPFDAGSLTQ